MFELVYSNIVYQAFTCARDGLNRREMLFKTRDKVVREVLAFNEGLNDIVFLRFLTYAQFIFPRPLLGTIQVPSSDYEDLLRGRVYQMFQGQQ